MSSRDVPTHPVTEEQGKGPLAKMKEALGLGGGSGKAETSVSEKVETSVKEHAEASRERVAGPGTPNRAGPVCAPSQVRGKAAVVSEEAPARRSVGRRQHVLPPLEAGSLTF